MARNSGETPFQPVSSPNWNYNRRRPGVAGQLYYNYDGRRPGVAGKICGKTPTRRALCPQILDLELSGVPPAVPGSSAPKKL